MTRRILLLQGPVGGFFGFLQDHLRNAGFEVRRLVFNGGDIAYALGTPYEVARIGSDPAAWFERFFGAWRPDAIVLLGDERPIHRAARRCAADMGIAVWCFEEGYVRPDHVSFEPDGSNANSTLRATFDPAVVPPASPPAPRLSGQTVAMGLRAWGYFVAHRTTRRFFPGYVHHRERRLRDEVRFWIRSAYRRVLSHRHDAALVKEILSGLHPPFFIAALQVHDDMQLRVHGRGWRNMSFVEMVLDSFRRAAPPETRLVIKAHPLDVGHGHHRRNIRLLIERFGLADRVDFLQSGPLLPIVRHARGLVTINSTAGIAALRNHVPVLAFGDALYHVEGLSRPPESVEDLDRFWVAPPEVDVVRAWRFNEHIFAAALLPGSFYLQSTWPALGDLVAARLRAAIDGEGGDGAPRSGPVYPAATPTAVSSGPVAPPPAPRCDTPSAIGIASSGIWRQRDTIATLLGGNPVRLHRLHAPACDVVVGWGHKSTARTARRIAQQRDLPYVALEDGFLRSVRPGAAEPSVGWIVDRTGVYYDSAGPSDLEAAIIRRAGDPIETLERARAAMRTIRELRLSKYNHAPMASAEALGLPRGRDVVVVVDQTFADASVSGARADGASFVRMLDTAIAENPGRTVVVKVHPETISGVKRGYLGEVARRRDVVVVAADVNPWALIESAVGVYVTSSQFGLEALLAGVPVSCFGAAAFAGWGLTRDHIAPIRRRTVVASREALAAAAYFDYCRWIDPYHGNEIDFESAADRLAFLRDRHFDTPASVCVGFSRWKRRSARQFLTGVGGAPRFVSDLGRADALAAARGGRVVVWGSRDASADGPPPRAPLVRAEDGFLRSVGLGASFVAPASLVFDDAGIYYDPRQASRLEILAETTAFDPALLARAARLRETIVTRGLSKYNDAGERRLVFPEGRLRILVPGQVEDDASVRLGSPEVRTNLDLLRRVRARWPDAHVIYKPHPDVDAGYRRGRIPDEIARSLADQIVTDVSMASVLSQVDRVETMTSLTGFEALLRGLAVATHGLPFYAGWGLTEDLLPCPRRTRRLGIDELVAATLILYPRYVDTQSGLPCPVEVVVDRLTAHRQAAETPLGRVRTRLRRIYAWATHNLIGSVAALCRRR